MNGPDKLIENNRDKLIVGTDGFSDYDKSRKEEFLNKSRSVQVVVSRKSHDVEENVTNDRNSTIDESFHDLSIILGSVATFLIMIILSVLGVIIAIVIRR